MDAPIRTPLSPVTPPRLPPALTVLGESIQVASDAPEYALVRRVAEAVVVVSLAGYPAAVDALSCDS